jgi:hypothetical protein
MKLFLVLIVTYVSLSHSWKVPTRQLNKAFGAVGVSISLLGSPFKAEARDGASATFASAEKAMTIAYENFDFAKSAWKSKAQRLVLDNQGIVGEKKRALMAVNNDLGSSATALQGIKDGIQQTIDQVTAEAETLKASTAASYVVADEAAAAGKRPAITSKLYNAAQIGADSVADDEVIIKDLIQIRDKVSEDEAMLRRVVQDLDTHLSTIVTAEKDTSQGAAMADAAIQGLSNTESFSGARLFKKGAEAVDNAQKSTWGALKRVQVDSRVANTVKVDITKILGKIDGDLARKAEEVKTMGKSPNTNAVGKGAIKGVQAKVSTGVKTVTSSVSKLNTFNDEVNNVYSNDAKKANAKKQRKIVNDLVPALKDVSKKLEIYESESKKTDSLLMKAKQAGEKEAERFRSSYKPKPMG